VVAVHKVQCSRCHTAPQPGTRTKPYLVDTFARHKKRVHLSQEEWTAMIDYLAAPAN
jgi:hypothetical protein